MNYTDEEIKNAFDEFLNKYKLIPYGIIRPDDFFKLFKAFSEGHPVFGTTEIYFEKKDTE